MARNAARKGGDSFSGASEFDVEDLVVELLLIWQKYKRKNELSEFCVLCDTKYKHVFKHISTRCLRLKKEVSRTLEMY